MKATDFGGDAPPFGKKWGLYDIDVEEWRGLVFVRLARGGPDLRWLGPFETVAADYPLEAQHFFSRRERDVAVGMARTTWNAITAALCIPPCAQPWTSASTGSMCIATIGSSTCTRRGARVG